MEGWPLFSTGIRAIKLTYRRSRPAAVSPWEHHALSPAVLRLAARSGGSRPALPVGRGAGPPNSEASQTDPQSRRHVANVRSASPPFANWKEDSTMRRTLAIQTTASLMAALSIALSPLAASSQSTDGKYCQALLIKYDTFIVKASGHAPRRGQKVAEVRGFESPPGEPGWHPEVLQQ